MEVPFWPLALASRIDCDTRLFSVAKKSILICICTQPDTFLWCYSRTPHRESDSGGQTQGNLLSTKKLTRPLWFYLSWAFDMLWIFKWKLKLAQHSKPQLDQFKTWLVDVCRLCLKIADVQVQDGTSREQYYKCSHAENILTSTKTWP